MPKLSDGSEPELHSLYTLEICVWFVEGLWHQEECHVTLRMLILTSKLLKEPFSRTINVFPYF